MSDFGVEYGDRIATLSFWSYVMIASVLLASSALIVMLVLALIREVRLRRALQTLLRRLLERWRSSRHE